MNNWIHEISKSYVAAHKPVRRDLKENYASLTEKQRFGLLSDNITSYFNEQIKNAYGFSLNDITQEQAGILIKSLFEEGVGKYDGPAPDEGSDVSMDKPTTKSISGEDRPKRKPGWFEPGGAGHVPPTRIDQDAVLRRELAILKRHLATLPPDHPQRRGFPNGPTKATVGDSGADQPQPK